MKQFNPDWVPPTYQDLRTKVFAGHPFHCIFCGAELQFKHPEYKYQKDNKRVLLNSYNAEPWCNHCLAKKIQEWFDDPLSPAKEKYLLTTEKRHVGKCQVCGEEKLVATSIHSADLNCRFGSAWWNGHWICCDCLVECAEHGHQSSGIGGWDNIGHYDKNEVGAKIYR